jgi:hypothetical protein
MRSSWGIQDVRYVVISSQPFQQEIGKWVFWSASYGLSYRQEPFTVLAILLKIASLISVVPGDSGI